MFTIYVYVLDTLADWELGNITAELHSRRFFKKDAPEISFQTVSISKETICSMGGMTITPDCLVDDIIMNQSTVLLLPGADTWNDVKHSAILEKAKQLLSIGATVCAICGATTALANYGLLDNRPHTSNGVGFLDMFCPNYKGKDFYVDKPSVTDHNLITASCTGGLLMSKQILAYLDVYKPDTLEFWYQYFSTGDATCFYALMESLEA